MMSTAQRMLRYLIVMTFILALLPVALSANNELAKEIKLGDEAAKDIEREVKLLEDDAIQTRLDTIGRRLAEIAKVTPVIASYGTSDLADFDYRFKVVDDKDINAFAIPGGRIYVNKGLLDYVRSDDELAAVLAHEIAHVAHHHSVKLLKKQSKMDTYIAVITLLSAISNLPGRDMQNIVYGAQLVKTSRMGGYGQEAELDADRTSVTYMVEAGYDPSAMLTFLSRLANDVERKPNLPLGIFRTHPPYRERTDNIVAELQKHGVDFDLSGSSGARVAVVRGTHLNEGRISEVAIAGRAVFRPADTGEHTSSERAATIAAELNASLQKTDTLDRTRISSDAHSITVNGDPVLAVQPEDVKLHGTTPDQLVRQAREALRFAIWCDRVHRIDEG